MIAVILLVVTIALSLIITRIGTLALALTGMSEDASHFQARSAFYGVGFTTAESESVVNHPVRRRIITGLMLSGNLGIATAVATILGSVMSMNSSGLWAEKLLILSAGLAAIVVAANSRWLYQVMSHLVAWALKRWTTLDVYDYVALLNLSGGYSVLRMRVEQGDHLANKSLKELNLSQEGILVLAIQREDEAFLGAPTGRTTILPQDTLIVYGPMQRLKQFAHCSSSQVGDGDGHRDGLPQANETRKAA